MVRTGRRFFPGRSAPVNQLRDTAIGVIAVSAVTKWGAQRRVRVMMVLSRTHLTDCRGGHSGCRDGGISRLGTVQTA
jgi:hypothetical protein